MPKIPTIDTPSVPGVPTPELGSVPSRRYDLSGVAGTLMAPTIEKGAFDGNARGMQQLGAGLMAASTIPTNVANVIEDFKKLNDQTNDVAAFSEADRIQTDFMAQRLAERETLPPDQWGTRLEETLPELSSKLAELKVSAGSAPKFNASIQQWTNSQRADAFISGRKAVMKNRTDAVLGEIQRKYEAGDVAGGKAAAYRGHESHLITDDQLKDIEWDGEKIHRTQLQNQILATDPRGYLAEMEEGTKTGKSEAYPWMDGNYEDFMRGAATAKARIAGLESDAIDSIKSGIANGSVTSMKDIEKENQKFGGIIQDKNLPAFQTMLNKLRPLDHEKYNDLAAAVSKYDPTQDPTREEKVSLKASIVTSLPDAAADELVKMLNDTESEGGNPVFRAGMSIIDKQFSTATSFDAKEKKKLSEDQRNQVVAVAQRTKYEKVLGLRKWMREHPSADEVQVTEYLNNALLPERTKSGASILIPADQAGSPGNYNGPGSFGQAYPMGGLPTQTRGSAIDAARAKLQPGGKPVSDLGGVFKGKDALFDAAASKYGVDPVLLKAIAAHETGNGSSKAVRERNNPGGLMNPKNWNELQSFGSLEEGIDRMAANLKRNYIEKGLTSIEAIQKKYAPVGAENDPGKLNKDWVSGVSSFYKKFGGAA